jgi:hypothetical protein
MPIENKKSKGDAGRDYPDRICLKKNRPSFLGSPKIPREA